MQNDMREEHGRLVAEARAIHDLAEKEGRATLNAQEQEQFGKIQARFEEIAAVVDREKKIQSAAALHVDLTKEINADGSRFMGAAVEKGFRSTPEFKAAFTRAMTQKGARFEDELAREIHATYSGTGQSLTDGDGGYLVPDDFEARIIKKAGETNVMRSISSISTTANTTKIIPRRLTIPAADVVLEKAGYGRDKMTFDQVTIAVHKIGVEIVASEEVSEDTAFDFGAEIVDAGGEGVGDKEEYYFVNGNGTNQPYGVLAEATTGITAASATAVTSDEIIQLIYKLNEKYLAKARLLMKCSTELLIALLKDGDQQYIWRQGLAGGNPNTIMGFPISYSSSMPAATAGLKAIAFGDFSKFRIVDKANSIGMVFDPYSLGSDGQYLWRFKRRAGSRLELAEAVQVMVMHA